MDELGHLFTWGSAGSGQLGLESGPAARALLSICASPQLVALPPRHKVRCAARRRPRRRAHDIVRMPVRHAWQVVQVSCGAAHTAAVTAEGALLAWGCNDGGRLGLGDACAGAAAVVHRPTRVRSMAHSRVVAVACGATHTVALTMLEQGDPPVRRDSPCGGVVFVAGHGCAVTPPSAVFRPAGGDAAGRPVRLVASGPQHVACVTAQGELLTWGDNTHGGAAQPVTATLVSTPTMVDPFVRTTTNLAFMKVRALAGAAPESDSPP